MAKKKPYRFALYLLLRGLGALLCLMPRPVAMAFARFLGILVYGVVKRQRDFALQNLRYAYGEEKSEAEIRNIAKGVMQNACLSAIEFLQFPKWTLGKVSRVLDGQEVFATYENLLKEGRGVISITAHLGNWELLAGVFMLKGFRGTVIGRKLYYDPFNRWVIGLRRSLGIETLYRDESARKIFKRLERNEIVGILPDQDMDHKKGVFVNYFGKPAHTAVAPVRLALATGAPIVVNFLVREKGGRFRLVLADIIRPQIESTEDHAVRKYTEQWMNAFERVIRQYPDQWAWMHNRWKTQPTSDPRPETLDDRPKTERLIAQFLFLFGFTVGSMVYRLGSVV